MKKKYNTIQFLYVVPWLPRVKMKKMASKYLVKTLSWLMKKVDVSRNRFFMRKKLAVFEPKKTKPW